MRRGLRFASLASWTLGLLALWHGEGVGQDLGTVVADDSCPATSLQATEELVVGSEPEVGLTGPVSAIVRTPEGGVALFNQGRLHFYGAERTLDHSLGRRGEGPGEFHNLNVIRVRDDGSVETWDGGLLRRTVFGGPPDFEVRETAPLPFAYGFQALERPNRQMVVNRNHATPDHAGLPLHIIDRDGTVLSSFGKEPPELDRTVAWPLRRSITWAGTSHDEVWSAHWREYRVERWSLEGELLGGFTRTVPWFEPWDVDGPIGPDAPPPPTIKDVYEFAPDAVGILLKLPRRDPSEGMELQGEYWIPVQLDRVYRTRIEVVDPDRACVRGSLDLEGYPIRFLDDGTIAIYEEDRATGVPRIRVLRIEPVG